MLCLASDPLETTVQTFRPRWIALSLIASPLLVAAGCAPTYGVDVYNATDKIVNVELLTLDPEGTMTVYSTGTINKEGTFINRMDKSPRGQTMRARFMIDGQKLEDENWVMLNLPTTQTRFFQLELADGRLKAVPQKPNRPEREKSAKD